jgi:hypothetical protein
MESSPHTPQCCFTTNEAPSLHQVTSLHELEDIVNDTYQAFNETFTKESHENPKQRIH